VTGQPIRKCPRFEALQGRARPLSVLEFARAADRRRGAEGARDCDRSRRPARALAGACAPILHRGREGGVQGSAGRETPIIPVMLGDARLAQDLAQALDDLGVFVAGFFFPVVPKGQARIRTQMSAALTTEDIDFAVSAFTEAGKPLGIV
jgi:glycine C-acetyltransferase